MNHENSEHLRAFFRRAQGYYPELFNMAHIICGNYDLAEYCLRSAILSVWQQSGGSFSGLRDKLRGALKSIALREALSARNETAEYTWTGLPELAEGDNPLLNLIAQEPNEVQRIILMRHACNFVPSRISRITGFTAGQVRGILDRFETRSTRKLTLKDGRQFDSLTRHAMESALNHPGIDLPDPSAVFRAFEAEAAGTVISSHRFSKVLGQALLLLLAILCAVAFWLFAVISAPPVMEASPSNTPAIQSEISNEPNPLM